LPFLSKLQGVGGHIKEQRSHFRIIEQLDHLADHPRIESTMIEQNTRHVYLTLTRQSMTTHEVVSRLSDLFSIPASEIGFAGLMSNRAICTQTFSLPRDLLPPELRALDALSAIGRRCASEDFTLEGEPWWQKSKLRTSQLHGNRFEIVLSDTDLSPQDAVAQTLQIADSLNRTGWANFYGLHHFDESGPEGAIARACSSLAGQSGKKLWLDTQLFNALQWALFNEYLAARISAGNFDTLWVGDLVSPPDSAMKPRMIMTVSQPRYCGVNIDIEADDPVPKEELAAFAASEISFTGPIFGAGMARARGAASELEQSVWQKQFPGVKLSHLKNRAPDSGRRVGRLPLPADLEIRESPEVNGLIFHFTLPKGADATSLLREFVGRECGRAREMEAPQDALAAQAPMERPVVPCTASGSARPCGDT